VDLQTITVLVPLRDDADAGAVAARIDALDDGADSPFARSARTHFARLVVVPADLPELRRPAGMRRGARILDLVTHLGRQQRRDHLWRPYLVFSAAFDSLAAPAGDRRAAEREYVAHLGAALGARAEEIWGACEGWPGVRDPAAFQRFLTEHTLPARYVFAPPHVGDVATVRQALARRQQVVDLAIGSAGATPAELRDRFLAVFGGDADPNGAGTGAALATVAAPSGPLPAQRGNGTAPADEDAEWNWWVRHDAHRFPHLPRVPYDGRPLDLGDVQGLTVGYPGHDAAAFVVLRVTHADRARRWLAALPVTTAAQANAIIDAAKPGATTGGAAGLPAVAVHVGFSHTGLAALGVTEEQLAGFDRSFRAGMAARERALAPGIGTDAWRPPFAPPPGRAVPGRAAPGRTAKSSPGADHGVHVLVHLSAATREELATPLGETVAGATASGGFAEPWVQDAGRIPDPRGDGAPAVPGERRRFVEHFGFADGISQPTITGVSRTGRGLSPAELPTGELLLGYHDVDGDTAGATAPADLRRNGTYLVFRKLEQDVPAFRATVRDAAARAGVEADEAAAKLVGRRRDGTVLTAAPGSDGPASLVLSFGEDEEGLHCPVGAHVRRVNPRDSRPLGDVGTGGTGGTGKDGDGERDAGLEARLVRRHLMIRRGIPYGAYLPEGAVADTASDTAPDAGRGLLFVALVGDIGRQFEFVQTQWMSDGTALRLGTDRDVFSGAACGAGAGTAPGKFTIQGTPPVLVPTPRPVVTCRGGEYFLVPGLAALRALTAPG
jgi:deferrochelatase/peroxidase EfeB